LGLRAIAFCGIAILLLLVRSPNVLAQTTTISDVSYTKTALYDIDTQSSNPSIVVNATVSYGDAKPGDYLAVGVFNLDDGDLVAGLGSSIPEPCSSTARFAACIIPLTNQQGSERMQFSLVHPKGVWSLALIAALLDNARDPISNSFSDYTFTIMVQTALILAVKVPPNVRVSVDGVNGSGGSILLALAAGNHTISVPESVPVNDTTRLRFLDWSDGSTAVRRVVELNHDITLNGNYITQYRLEIISPVSVSGAGWYDTGAVVTLSIGSAAKPMVGIVGALGGKWVFQGWAEDNAGISRSTTTSVKMNSAQVVNAVWAPDYGVPLTTLVIISLLSAAAFYVMRTKLAAQSTRKHRRRLKRR